MSDKMDGGCAFPVVFQADARFNDSSGDHAYAESYGMTLRDYFAAHALSAGLPNAVVNAAALDWDPEVVAANAYRLADAMIAERSKE